MALLTALPFSFTVGVESMPLRMIFSLSGTSSGAYFWDDTHCVNDGLVSPILRPSARSRLMGKPPWARSSGWLEYSRLWYSGHEPAGTHCAAAQARTELSWAGCSPRKIVNGW